MAVGRAKRGWGVEGKGGVGGWSVMGEVGRIWWNEERKAKSEARCGERAKFFCNQWEALVNIWGILGVWGGESIPVTPLEPPTLLLFHIFDTNSHFLQFRVVILAFCLPLLVKLPINPLHLLPIPFYQNLIV